MRVTSAVTCVAVGRFTCVMAVVALLALTTGIYPSDHWSHSTKLTKSNFDSFIKKEVDAHKTVFVRWIASEG